MPWCPKCRSEYEKGIKTCYDCRCDLVDKLPPSHDQKPQPDQEAFLMTVADEVEYLIVESKLRGYGVPVVRRHRQGGDLTNSLMGMSRLGLDIFVPESALSEAKLILEMEPGQHPNAQAHKEETAYTKKKPSFFTIFLIIIAGYALIRFLSQYR